MATKNVKFKSKSTGDYYYPVTAAENVTTTGGKNLAGVEPDAQVNKIETVKINGTAAPIANKTINLTLQTYSLVKQETAETGFSASYYLADKDGVQRGAKINLAKDMFLQSASVKTCTTANQPVTGYAVGDVYVDFVLANAENSHVYLLAKDLITQYTAGTGVIISNNTISINLTELKNTFATKSTTLAGYGITDCYTKTQVDNLLADVSDLTFEVL